MASRPTSGTSSRSSASSEGAETRAHSAVHVLKGAIEKALGPKHFTSVEIEGSRGTLKMRADGPVSSEEVVKIESEANGKVAEDAEFLEFEMEKQEAEAHFGRGIYDMNPAPVKDPRLNIVRIPQWDVACCSRAHVGSTAVIGAIKIEEMTYDGARGELQVTFRVR